MKISDFRSIFFDCDGVILNSNKIKTQAFKSVSKKFGKNSSSLLVNYHLKNGGVSRYKKFQHFIENILPKNNPTYLIKNKEKMMEDLLVDFSNFLKSKLLKCDVAKKLKELKFKTLKSNWFVVSGSDQQELRDLFLKRDIYEYFDGGIYGSPLSKQEIITNLINMKNVYRPALFIGDSKLDHEVAKKFNFDFYFISGWSEFNEYKDYCFKKKIPIYKTLSGIIN
tara:strand:+ start:2363 stop:3034 length:672 start_codon:yes stop_codon:yes gene_type:complete